MDKTKEVEPPPRGAGKCFGWTEVSFKFRSPDAKAATGFDFLNPGNPDIKTPIIMFSWKPVETWSLVQMKTFFLKMDLFF